MDRIAKYAAQGGIRQFTIVFFVILTLGILAYSNTFHASFHLDDFKNIVHNKNLSTIGNPFAKAEGVLLFHSRHLPFFTFALNYHFGQLDVFGYHVFNFAVHILTACLLWWFVILLFETPRLKDDQSSKLSPALIAFFAALLFLVHPVNTQAIVYISQRFESMAAMFYLAAVCLYLKGRMAPSAGGYYLFLCVLATVGGMLCKETVITLPLMLVMIEVLFLKGARPLSRRVEAVAIGVGLCVLLIIPTLFAYKLAPLFLDPKVSLSHDHETIHLHEYLLTQSRVFTTFLRLFIVPVGQNFDYDFPKSSGLLTPWTTFGSLILLIGVFLASLRLRTKHILLAFGIWWLFLTFLPNLVPRTFVIFEHKFYLISIALMMSVPVLFFLLFQERRHAIILLTMIVVLFAGLTYERNKVWKDQFSLWSDVIQKSPNKYTANLNLGSAYAAKGNREQAFVYLNRALDIHPLGLAALLNRAMLYMDQGRYPLALEDMNTAIDSDPAFYEGYVLRGRIFDHLNEYDRALEDFNKAVFLKADDPRGRIGRGSVLSKTGRVDEGLSDFLEIIRVWPRHAMAHYNCGVSYTVKGNDVEALEYFNKAIALDPRFPLSYLKRGELFDRKGQAELAQKDYQEFRELNDLKDASK